MAEICVRVQVYVKHIILLCAHIVYKRLQAQCTVWIILNVSREGLHQLAHSSTAAALGAGGGGAHCVCVCVCVCV